MADAADIAGDNDFNEERLRAHLKAVPKAPTQPRGKCLFCQAKVDVGLYCDDDCKTDYEREQLIKSKTSRIINHGSSGL